MMRCRPSTGPSKSSRIML